MELIPQLFTAKVMHKRYFPRVNAFTYGVYYLCVPLSKIKELSSGLLFGVNSPALFGFYEKDHGARDGSDLTAWAKTLLEKHSKASDIEEIMLVAMPRILGFVFNPVSFWMCFDKEKKLRAVIAEVNNTFKETHSYICANADGSALDNEEWLTTEKLFHVSPFLERKGEYAFRFDVRTDNIGIWIDYFLEKDQKQLATSLTGGLRPFNPAALLSLFVTIPFVTIKTIALIHWQALILAFKKIRYIDKPPQAPVRISTTQQK